MAEREWEAFKGTPDYAEALKRLVKGENLTAIAEFIQSRGHCPGIAVQSVRRQLDRLSKEMVVLDGEVLPMAEVAERAEKIDAIQQLEKLVLLQMARVESARELEVRLGVSLPAVGKEIMIGAEILARYVELMQSLGLAIRVATKVMLGVAQMDGATLNQGTLPMGRALAALPGPAREAMMRRLLEGEHAAKMVDSTPAGEEES